MRYSELKCPYCETLIDQNINASEERQIKTNLYGYTSEATLYCGECQKEFFAEFIVTADFNVIEPKDSNTIAKRNLISEVYNSVI